MKFLFSLFFVASTAYATGGGSGNVCTRKPYVDLLPLSNFPIATRFCALRFPCTVTATNTVAAATVLQTTGTSTLTQYITTVTSTTTTGTTLLTVNTDTTTTITATQTTTNTVCTGAPMSTVPVKRTNKPDMNKLYRDLAGCARDVLKTACSCIHACGTATMTVSSTPTVKVLATSTTSITSYTTISVLATAYTTVTTTTVTQTNTQFAAATAYSCHIEACSSLTNAPVSTPQDQQGWDFSALAGTRATGHVDYVSNGLHVYTEGATTTDKAVGYKTITIPFKDLGVPGITFSTYTGGRAGLQLVAYLNGVYKGILVGEFWVYGDGNYWSNGQFGTGPKYGYNSFGTLDDYYVANPGLEVRAIGFSLGSGVKGDEIISSITAGCMVYTWSSGTS